MIKILITGVNSYIGTSFETHISADKSFEVNSIDMKSDTWKEYNFSKYDCVFHVAGIAHDTGKKKDSSLYYKVNTELAIETIKKAKKDGVRQFIFMSSMLVYNGCKSRVITKSTFPKVKGFYGDSKLQADLKLQLEQSDDFKVAIVRPPMIFGSGCKGNFPRLVHISKKIPIFPKIKNKRSMLHITNLCEFIKLLIVNKSNGIFFPQNSDYFSTTDIVRLLSEHQERKIWFTKLFNIPIHAMKPFLGVLNKLFGDLYYDTEISSTFDNKYILLNNTESILEYLNDNLSSM